MNDLLDRDGVKWIVETILEQAETAMSEFDEEQSAFFEGRLTAYYELLDSIRNRIVLMEGKPEEYGLDFEVDHLTSELEKRTGKKFYKEKK